MEGVETRLDGSTLIVRIPMRFQRRGGRKRIMAPDGSETDGWARAALGAVSGRVGEAAPAVLNTVAGKRDGFVRLRERLLSASAGSKSAMPLASTGRPSSS